jgi:hypothetical protein
MATSFRNALLVSCFLVFVETTDAQDKPIVGLIPKAQKPLKFDGKLADWEGTFVTPVHIGHPDFANRGGKFYYLWDDDDLPPGDYTVEVTALDKEGKVVTARTEKILHGMQRRNNG